MGFLTKWLINILVLFVIAVLVYAFLPAFWNLVWSLATGFYRPVFIIAMLLLAGLPALRSD